MCRYKIIHLTKKLNSLNLGPLPTSLNMSQIEIGNMLDIHCGVLKGMITVFIVGIMQLLRFILYRWKIKLTN